MGYGEGGYGNPYNYRVCEITSNISRGYGGMYHNVSIYMVGSTNRL